MSLKEENTKRPELVKRNSIPIKDMKFIKEAVKALLPPGFVGDIRNIDASFEYDLNHHWNGLRVQLFGMKLEFPCKPKHDEYSEEEVIAKILVPMCYYFLTMRDQ